MTAAVDPDTLSDLVAGLRKRSDDCRSLMDGRDEPERSRLLGKSLAYAHAAEMLVSVLAGGEP